MKIPVEVQLRQDEMRRAAQVQRESEPRMDADNDRTIAHDCAAMLEAWFKALESKGKAVVLPGEVNTLARRMRSLGDMRRYL